MTSGEWRRKVEPDPVTPVSGGRRRPTWVWVAVVVGVLAVFSWPLLGGLGEKEPEPPPPVTRAKPDVLEYHVTGTAKTAAVTYKTGTGTQQNTVDVPMKNKGGGVGVTMKGSAIPSFKYISAQNQDSYGSITCQIILNGVTISENTSSGAYVIASCQA